MHGKKSRILQWPQRIRLYFSTRLVPLAKHAKHRNHGYYRNASFIGHCKPASACTLCDCNCSLRKLRWRNEKTHRFQLSSWTIVELSFNYSHTWLSKWPPFYLEPCTQQSTFLSLNTLYNAIFIHDENHKELPIYSTADTAAKWKISRDFQIMWN